MHELAITDRILSAVLKHARREKARAVRRVLLVVSELSDLHPLWLQRYFSELARGSVAANARLEIQSQAPEFDCGECHHRFFMSLGGIDRVVCPHCGSASSTLLSVPDYVVEEIEVVCE